MREFVGTGAVAGCRLCLVVTKSEMRVLRRANWARPEPGRMAGARTAANQLRLNVSAHVPACFRSPRRRAAQTGDERDRALD